MSGADDTVFPEPRKNPELIGHESAEARFLSAWQSGRLPHGWLITGPRGIGKATFAFRVARFVLSGGVSDQPAGLFGDAEPASLFVAPDEPVFRRIASGAHADLTTLQRTINPDTGKLRTSIAVDDVRSAGDFMRLTASEGGWRVVVVDCADEMNVNAANALLKILEEPPDLALLLLVSHAPRRLLPTIRSRCRTLDLRPLGPADLAAALEQAEVPVTGGEAGALAQIAGGSVGEALRLDAGGGVALYGRLVGLLGRGDRVDRGALMALADGVAGRGAETLYELAGRLVVTLVGRLARHAAIGAPDTEAGPGEAALMAVVAHRPGQAALWAEAAGRIAATISHARAVNLDPGQTIIDTFLDLDATLTRARAVA